MPNRDDENVKDGRNASDGSVVSRPSEKQETNHNLLLQQGALTAAAPNRISVADALTTIQNPALLRSNIQAQRLGQLVSSLGGPMPPSLSLGAQVLLNHNPLLAPEVYDARVQARQAAILHAMGSSGISPAMVAASTPNPRLLNNPLLMLASASTSASVSTPSSVPTRPFPPQQLSNAPAPVVAATKTKDAPKEASKPVPSTASSANNPETQKAAVPQYQSLEERLKGIGTDEGVSESFPSKLHRLLLDLESVPGGSDIACFLPEGNSFMIVDSVRFESEIMKKYFPRMGSFASFQRQLNIYDFNRISRGLHKGAYYHQCFVKSYPLLSRSMKRRSKGSKPSGSRKT